MEAAKLGVLDARRRSLAVLLEDTRERLTARFTARSAARPTRRGHRRDGGGPAPAPGRRWVAGRWYVYICSGVPRLLAFVLRLVYCGSKGPWLRKSSGVYKHDDTRPRLGRKIAGESRRELKDLGLLVDPDLKRRGLGGREIVAVGRSWSVGAEQL